MEQIINDRNVFLTVLEAKEFKVIAPVDSESGKGLPSVSEMVDAVFSHGKRGKNKRLQTPAPTSSAWPLTLLVKVKLWMR